MIEASREELLKKVNDLFLKAEKLEQIYQWDEEIEILNRGEKFCGENDLKKLQAKIYLKLGEIYLFITEYEQSKEKVCKYFHLSIESFQKAFAIFEQDKNEAMIFASSGNIELVKYIMEAEKGKEVAFIEAARQDFHKAGLIFKENGDQINLIKMKILESYALSVLLGEKLIRIDENSNIKTLITEHKQMMKEIWDTIINHQNFPGIYIHYTLKSNFYFQMFMLLYSPAEIFNVKENLSEHLDLIKELIIKLENSKINGNLFDFYVYYANSNLFYGTLFVTNQFEQRKYLKIAMKWLEKAESFLSNMNSNLSVGAFYYNRFMASIFLISLGFFAKGFKHVLDDFNKIIDVFSLTYPRIHCVHGFLYATGIIMVGAFTSSTPDDQRVNFVNIALRTLDILTENIPMASDHSYRAFYFYNNSQLCGANAILADLNSNEKEKLKHLQVSTNMFNRTPEPPQKYEDSFNFTGGFAYFMTRAGILLGKNIEKVSEKVFYYEKTIELLKKTKKLPLALIHVESLFLIADAYFEIGRLTQDEGMFKESYLAYNETIEYCKNKGYFNLVGSGHVFLAKIEDRLGNYHAAAEQYQKGIESFDKAILSLSYGKLNKKIAHLQNYLKAWKLIEIAKAYQYKQSHNNASKNYEDASNLLQSIRAYRFEAPFYAAWAILEKAEDISKKNDHEQAAKLYLEAGNQFKEVIEKLTSFMKIRTYIENKERISKLIRVAEVRQKYCIARNKIDTARLRSKQGNHELAAELYNKAANIFNNLCQIYKIDKEKNELATEYYLCKAWQAMELAETEQKSSLYADAADLYKKASEIFPESRMKRLALGNSLFCIALENGKLFDESRVFTDKIVYYKNIKMFLRDSSRYYKLGGFEQDAQWALATSTFFDGIWNLILLDNEIDLSKKNNYLTSAKKNFNSAKDIFEKAGYLKRKEIVLNYLEIIKDKQSVHASALAIIKKPAIYESNMGILAPSCPIEISSSLNIEELQKNDLEAESESNWRERINHLFLFTQRNGIIIHDFAFKESDLEPNLVSGGLSGLSMLIQEITRKETRITIIEQEDISIMLEYGKYLCGALITEDNLVTLRNKLKQLIEEVEEYYSEELQKHPNQTSLFSEVGQFTQKIFEK